jgi:hypothetical protein
MTTFNHLNLSEQAIFGSLTTPILADGSVTLIKLGVQASKVIQDITYTALTGGVAGNNITIQYIEDGTAGFETVTVTGTAIVVHIGDHTVQGSTAAQVEAALLTFQQVANLVIPVITGTSSNIQLATGPTNLTGGVTGGATGVSSINADSNPLLTGAVQFISGAHISLSQVGNAITVNATGELSATLTNAHLFVGNPSNVATDVALSGDATLANTGALTLATVNSNVGSFTNANITVNAKGLITAVANGSSAARYQQDLFQYSGSNVFTLTFPPISNSQIVLFNGLGLVSGMNFDYTLLGNVLTLNAAVVLKAGDQILVIYSY